MGQEDDKANKLADDAAGKKDLLEEELLKALHGRCGKRTFGFSDSLKIIKKSMDEFHRRQEEMFSGTSLGKLMRESKSFSDRIQKFDVDWRKQFGLDRLGKPLFRRPPWADLPEPKIPESPWMKIHREAEGLRKAALSVNPSEFAANRRPMSKSLFGIADDLQHIRETTIKLTLPCPVRRTKPKEVDRPLGAVETSVGMPSLPPPPSEHVLGLAKAEQSARQAGEALESAKDGQITKAQKLAIKAKVNDFLGDLSDVARLKVTVEIEKTTHETLTMQDEVRSAECSVRSSAECGVQSAKCEVQGAKCEVSARAVEVRRGKIVVLPEEGDAPQGEVIDVSAGEDDTAEVKIGKWASKFVTSVNAKTWTITFKGKNFNVVQVPKGSRPAWDLMVAAIETDDKEGWAETPDCSRSWKAPFNRKAWKGANILKSFKPLKQLEFRLERGEYGDHLVRLKKFDFRGYKELLKKNNVPLK